MGDWVGILWAVGALILVAPAAYRMIKGNPDAALKSVAMWLGLALAAGWMYENGGLKEWWEAKHGYSRPPTVIAPSDPSEGRPPLAEDDRRGMFPEGN